VRPGTRRASRPSGRTDRTRDRADTAECGERVDVAFRRCSDQLRWDRNSRHRNHSMGVGPNL